MDSRHLLQQCIKLQNGVSTADNIVTLTAWQPLAVWSGVAVEWVASEKHTSARTFAQIAEHHRLNCDGGATDLGDAPVLTVGARTRGLPRVEHGRDRRAQLSVGVIRDRLAHVIKHECTDFVSCWPRNIWVKVGLEHDVAELMAETRVGFACVLRVTSLLGKARLDFIGDAKVEHRVHHARHAHCST